eukprot:tig00000718_g3753.t1
MERADRRAAALRAVARLAGRPLPLFRCDLRDRAATARALAAARPWAVCHLAARKSVPESLESAALYWDVNVGGTAALLSAAEALPDGPRVLVFASSSTVYGDGSRSEGPLQEAAAEAAGATCPYGASKRAAEEMLEQVAAGSSRGPGSSAGRPWRVVALRLFNPVGAHESGALRERGAGPHANLMPRIERVLRGAERELTVHGAGRGGARDFFHGALFRAFNVASGEPCSVLRLARLVERTAGRPLPLRYGPGRAGDALAVWADVAAAAAPLEAGGLAWRPRRPFPRPAPTPRASALPARGVPRDARAGPPAAPAPGGTEPAPA